MVRYRLAKPQSPERVHMFDPCRFRLESAAEWSATGLENRGIRKDGSSILPLSAMVNVAQSVERLTVNQMARVRTPPFTLSRHRGIGTLTGFKTQNLQVRIPLAASAPVEEMAYSPDLKSGSCAFESRRERISRREGNGKLTGFRRQSYRFESCRRHWGCRGFESLSRVALS